MNPDKFQQSLKQLAVSLETPVVPGELEIWIAELRKSAQSFGTFLHLEVATGHNGRTAEIAKVDPEMHRDVEQLNKTDREILEQFAAFSSHIDHLAKRVPRVGPNEAAVTDELKTLVDEGLAFIIHMKKQEIAIRTSVQEAFNRDRGVGD